MVTEAQTYLLDGIFMCQTDIVIVMLMFTDQGVYVD